MSATKNAAFLFYYRGRLEYGNRSAASRIAAALAPLAALRADAGRIYVAGERRRLSELAASARASRGQ